MAETIESDIVYTLTMPDGSTRDVDPMGRPARLSAAGRAAVSARENDKAPAAGAAPSVGAPGFAVAQTPSPVTVQPSAGEDEVARLQAEIAALRAQLAGGASGDSADASADDSATASAESSADASAIEPADYGEPWKIDSLKEEVARRGLTVEGSGANGRVVRNDLVAALEADDKAKAGGASARRGR